MRGELLLWIWPGAMPFTQEPSRFLRAVCCILQPSIVHFVTSRAILGHRLRALPWTQAALAVLLPFVCWESDLGGAGTWSMHGRSRSKQGTPASKGHASHRVQLAEACSIALAMCSCTHVPGQFTGWAGM